jgi:hypothetical protein
MTNYARIFSWNCPAVEVNCAGSSDMSHASVAALMG